MYLNIAFITIKRSHHGNRVIALEGWSQAHHENVVNPSRWFRDVRSICVRLWYYRYGNAFIPMHRRKLSQLFLHFTRCATFENITSSVFRYTHFIIWLLFYRVWVVVRLPGQFCIDVPWIYPKVENFIFI